MEHPYLNDFTRAWWASVSFLRTLKKYFNLPRYICGCNNWDGNKFRYGLKAACLKIKNELYKVDDKIQILFNLKSIVQEVMPDAEIILFGSRVNGTATEESDWDVLVLSPEELVTSELKKMLHNKIFPLSVSIGAFINLLLISKKDWSGNPSYYSLHKTIAKNNQLL